MRVVTLCFCFISLVFCEKLPQKVIICGVCKNTARRLPYSTKIMEKIGELFSDYHIIVYENNSSDTTAAFLQNWSKQNPKILAISEELTENELKKTCVNWDYALKNFSRPECIARARNIVQDVAMSEQYKQFEYLIWMDMDFKYDPNYEGFIETFKLDKKWDAVLAYGTAGLKDNIWDWYAFRDSQFPLGPELLGISWWHRFKKFTLNFKGDWYPVYSAFGGCGIYKKSSIQGCHYSGIVTKDLALLYKKILQKEPEANQFIQQYYNYTRNLKKTVKITDQPSFDLPDIKDIDSGVIIENIDDTIWRVDQHVRKYPSVCEHVPLHASMIAHGHDKLFINPRLVFYYDNDTDHA